MAPGKVTLRFLAFFMFLAAAACGDSTFNAPEDRESPDSQAPGAAAALPDDASRAAAGWTTAVDPKPLSETVKKGLAWLVAHQHASGGFGQGEESPQMGRALQNLAEKPNVGDTCAAALAFVRSGSTPAAGDYAKPLKRAVDFVCSRVEAAPDKGLSVTDVQGTRLQMKLGTHIDTFLAAMLLAEVRGRMGDEAGNKRVAAALDKVMDKIEKNQQADGSFKQHGWATVLSQAMGAKGINRARQAGAAVDEEVMLKASSVSQRAVQPLPTGVRSSDALGRVSSPVRTFDLGGSAGVELYAAAGNLGALRDTANTAPMMRRALEMRLEEADAPEEKERIQDQLQRLDRSLKTEARARRSVVARLNDPRFISGFGSNGGEEFLSYMNISESLVVEGSPEWERWDAAMTQNLSRIQNADGSWSGHHCITGRNFCTAAALLTLMADRTPVPADVVAK